MKTIDEYAIDLVVTGIHRAVEEDHNWAEDIAQEDHYSACDLARRLADAIEAKPDAVLGIVAAADLAKLRAALGAALDTMGRLQAQNEASGLFVGALAYQGAAELVRQALRGGDDE